MFSKKEKVSGEKEVEQNEKRAWQNRQCSLAILKI